MAGRIDVHAHLLPGLDDGSTSIHESLEIARRMVDAGYSHVTCSPHIWPGHAYAPTFILERVAALQAMLDAEGIAIRLIAGGELNLTSLDILALADDEIPTYGMARRHVLFDFWSIDLPDDYWPRIERFQKLGATPVQAHPERIMAFQQRPELLDALRDRGVLLQGNLQCFADKAGSRTRACVEKWAGEGRYFMLATDLHRLDTLDIRLAGLKNATALLGEDMVDRLTITNPREVVGAST